MTQNSTSKSDLQYATWVKECLEKEAFSKKLMSTCSWNISVPHSKFLAKALTSYHPNINKRTSSKGATHLCCTCFCLTVAHFQEFCQKSHVARRQDHWNWDISLLQTKLHLSPINCSGNKRPGKECHPNHGHKYCSRGCFLTLKQNNWGFSVDQIFLQLVLYIQRPRESMELRTHPGGKPFIKGLLATPEDLSGSVVPSRDAGL